MQEKTTKEDDEQSKPKPKPNYFQKGVSKIPKYQLDIIEEIISTIQQRGGRFLGYSLKPMAQSTIRAKIHQRFRDIKNAYLRKKTNKTNFACRGYTSKKNTIPGVQVEDETGSSGSSNSDCNHESESEDEDEDEKEEGEYNKEEAAALRKRRREQKEGIKRQANEREERLKKRRRQQQQEEQEDGEEAETGDDKGTTTTTTTKTTTTNETTDQPKRKRKIQKRSYSEFDDLDKMDPTTMSEYEKLRYEKMRRNRQRLAELGLLPEK